ILAAGKTYVLENGKTQTITSALNASATCNGIIAIQSSNSGSQATISKTSGSVMVNYVSLKDINATGGASFIANNAVDLGNNTGWTINTAIPQNLYWVGGSGNWNDPNHWSASSGGLAGTCIPTAFDDVFFDANSGFTPSSKTVTINVSTAFCNSMDWTGAINTPILTGNSSNILKIYGSLTLISAMSFSFNGSIEFQATTVGNTITMNGQSAQIIYFLGTGGWILQDAFTAQYTISFQRGSLNTNNQTVTGGSFISQNSNPKTLTLGSSTLNLFYWSVAHSNLTFNSGTSTINVGGATFEAFNSGTETYYNLNFTNPNTSSGLQSSSGTIFHDVTFNGGGSIFGNNVFNNLILAAGKTYVLENGKTQTIQNLWKIQGSCISYILLQSNTNGNFATVTKTSGDVNGFNIHMRDIKTTGGATFNAYNSVDLGGNSGWIFSILPALAHTGTITGSTSVCVGANGVNYSITPVIGAISYLWTVPSGATINSGQGETQLAVNFGTPVSGNVTVQAFNGCEYSAASILGVVVNANLTPTVSIAALTSGAICVGTSVTFIATASDNGGGSINYDFKVNGTSVQNSVANTYSTTTLANGNAVTCDIAVTGGACLTTNTASSNIYTITVYPLPIVNVPTVVQPTCVTPTGTIIVNASGSGTLEYSIDGGANWFITNVFSGLAPGNYNIAVRSQSAPSCVSVYSGNPVIFIAATNCCTPVDFGTVASGNQTMCNGSDPSNITFSMAPSGGAIGGSFDYQWYYKDGVSDPCPTGTSTSGWTLISGATSSSYDPPLGLTTSRTYAVIVDPTGTPACDVATWANSCRKVTVLNFNIDASTSSNPVALGNIAVLSATVTPNMENVSVSFYLDNVLKGTSFTNASGVATLNISGLPADLYQVKAVMDNGCAEAIAFLPVYDPNGGFVTGGGWFYSLPGNYLNNAAAEGKANFGFVAKYQKGSNVPDGNTEFQFKAGDLNFKSSSYNPGSLVIAGARAIYKGTGTINGGGNYGFMVSAIDGQVSGGGGYDKFRIKIWDKNNSDAIVYDNQMNAAENADASTVLGGGSIVIQNPKKSSKMNGSQNVIAIIAEPATFNVKVFSNPSTTDFGIYVTGEQFEKVSIRVIDIYGKVIELRNNINTGQEVRIGHNYFSGIYIVEVVQGKNRKIIKLIKLY
ncbi:MAG: T9SS type A sorting domain-containing protein, partial [Bacteroidota bacterium]